MVAAVVVVVAAVVVAVVVAAAVADWSTGLCKTPAFLFASMMDKIYGTGGP